MRSEQWRQVNDLERSIDKEGRRCCHHCGDLRLLIDALQEADEEIARLRSQVAQLQPTRLAGHKTARRIIRLLP
jgi:hypothetical protein